MKQFKKIFYYYCKTGNIHLIGSKSLHVVLEELSKIYGKVLFAKAWCSPDSHTVWQENPWKKLSLRKLRTLLEDLNYRLLSIRFRGALGFLWRITMKSIRKTGSWPWLHFTDSLEIHKNVDKILQIEARKAEAHFDSYAETGGEFFPLDVFEKVIPSMFLAMMYGVDLSYEDEDLKHITSVLQKMVLKQLKQIIRLTFSQL